MQESPECGPLEQERGRDAERVRHQIPRIEPAPQNQVTERRPSKRIERGRVDQLTQFHRHADPERGGRHPG